jgi:cytochrome d ubiquinol oxidase subunit II
MPLELVLGGAIVGALVLYFLFGGADFGGGVWDLLASGPRRQAQRGAIEHAIGPIWEANHVWLILVVVIVFTGFPRAFAAASVAFHVPLTLFLLGIVFRGASFAFRSFDPGGAPGAGRARFGLAFSIASVVSPVLLGMVVGAAASGRVEVKAGAVVSGYFAPWLMPFPLVTGLFALALCAQLAATFLTSEATEPALADDFRARALGATAAVAALGLATLLLSFAGAPRIAEGLTRRPWAWPLELGAVAAGALGAWALWRRRFRLARLLVPAQAGLIVIGWAAAQYPYLLVDDVTLTGAAANPRTLGLLAMALAAGIPVLLPSLYLLFRVFKTRGPGRGDQGQNQIA